MVRAAHGALVSECMDVDSQHLQIQAEQPSAPMRHMPLPPGIDRRIDRLPVSGRRSSGCPSGRVRRHLSCPYRPRHDRSRNSPQRPPRRRLRLPRHRRFPVTRKGLTWLTTSVTAAVEDLVAAEGQHLRRRGCQDRSNGCRRGSSRAMRFGIAAPEPGLGSEVGKARPAGAIDAVAGAAIVAEERMAGFADVGHQRRVGLDRGETRPWRSCHPERRCAAALVELPATMSRWSVPSRPWCRSAEGPGRHQQPVDRPRTACLSPGRTAPAAGPACSAP